MTDEEIASGWAAGRAAAEKALTEHETVAGLRRAIKAAVAATLGLPPNIRRLQTRLVNHDLTDFRSATNQLACHGYANVRLRKAAGWPRFGLAYDFVQIVE
jgi:hypothetical protein